MITGLHGMFVSAVAEELRAFLPARLKPPCTDTGGGRQIFPLPAAELGCHPVGEAAAPGFRDVSFDRDDTDATVAEPKSNGVALDGGIADRGYRRAIHFTMPAPCASGLTSRAARATRGKHHAGTASTTAAVSRPCRRQSPAGACPEPGRDAGPHRRSRRGSPTRCRRGRSR